MDDHGFRGSKIITEIDSGQLRCAELHRRIGIHERQLHLKVLRCCQDLRDHSGHRPRHGQRRQRSFDVCCVEIENRCVCVC